MKKLWAKVKDLIDLLFLFCIIIPLIWIVYKIQGEDFWSDSNDYD